jgi:hypothetical protein
LSTDGHQFNVKLKNREIALAGTSSGRFCVSDMAQSMLRSTSRDVPATAPRKLIIRRRRHDPEKACPEHDAGGHRFSEKIMPHQEARAS